MHTMNTTGVSFLVPVYNKEKYLPKVLESIYSQRGNFEKEYIFVDDGSTDKSLEILRNITSNWENVIIFSQENKGSAAATNKCISLARHPYLKFVDADDLLTVDGTRVLLDALIKNENCCLSYGNVSWYSNEDQINLTETHGSGKISITKHPLKSALRTSLFNPSQFLARRESVRYVGGCDEAVVHSQEYSLTLRLAKLSSFLHVNQIVTLRPESVPDSLGSNQARQLKRVTLACANFLKDNPDIEKTMRRFACRRAATRAWHFARRHHDAGLTSRWFRLYLQGLLPATTQSAFIVKCAEVFDLET